MPELLEVEIYRRHAESLVGRQIAKVDASDQLFWRGELPALLLEGAKVTGVRRIGKLLLIDTEGPTLGLRFGMTGRLVVDGVSSIEELVYSAADDRPEWRRFTLTMSDGGSAWVSDPRRLGSARLDPDEGALGIDATRLDRASLATVLGTSKAALKSKLMDQARIAGLGNLLTDEILWRAGLDPRRPAGGLTTDELDDLVRHIAEALEEMGERGGSHTGDLQAHRRPGSTCPIDGTALRRDTIGGRTTWWCQHHQR